MFVVSPSAENDRSVYPVEEDEEEDTIHVFPTKWMEHLPASVVEKVPLTQLVWPGSSHAGSYTVSATANDWVDEGFVERMTRQLFLDRARSVAHVQILSLAKQVMAGSRFLDVRITPMNGVPHLHNKAVGTPFIPELQTLLAHLERYPKEVVVCWIQPSSAYTTATFTAALCEVRDVCGAALVSRETCSATSTLQDVYAARGGRGGIVLLADAHNVTELLPEVWYDIGANADVVSLNITQSDSVAKELDVVYRERQKATRLHIVDICATPSLLDGTVIGSHYPVLRQLRLHLNQKRWKRMNCVLVPSIEHLSPVMVALIRLNFV